MEISSKGVIISVDSGTGVYKVTQAFGGKTAAVVDGG